MNEEVNITEFKKIIPTTMELIFLAVITILLFLIGYWVQDKALYVFGALFLGRSFERWRMYKKLNKLITA